MPSPQTLDIAIPTYESEAVIGDTLDDLAISERAGSVKVGTLRVMDNESNDDTLSIIRDRAKEHGWETDITCSKSTLPVARSRLIGRVDTDWFLFLDDDVRIAEDYLEVQAECIAPRTGGVQGRKTSQSTINDDLPEEKTGGRHPSAWVHHRSFRGGTHATLIRREAADGVSFPSDLSVWEDQYLRRYIESQGYVWTFNHAAHFAHRTQNPRTQGWTEGYLQGKYNLRPAWHVCLGIPNAAVSDGSVSAAITQLAGFIAGWVRRVIS